MHTVFKKALVIASLLLVTRSAAAVDEFSGPTPPPLDDTYLTALAAAANAGQVPADPQAVSAIPEPPVYIMLLVGVGLLGLVARRQSIPPIFKNEQD